MTKKNKFYLTKQGLERVEKEHQKLKELRKIRLKKDAPLLVHSEEVDTESICWREDMELLDSKIQEMEHILNSYEFIKPPSKKERDKINLGAQVSLEIDGQGDEFFIVGTLEANPSAGKISNESPVGQALMGRKAGDEVTISSPIKTLYKIKRVRYKTA